MTLKTKLIAITLSVLIATLLAISLPVSLSVSEQKSQPIKFDELPKDYQFNRLTLEDDNDSIKLDNIPKLYKYLPNSQVKTAVLSEADEQAHISEEMGVNESVQEIITDKVEEKEVIDDIKEVREIKEEENEYIKKVTFEVTAYTAGYESTGKSPDHPAYGITASGNYVKENYTIACPRRYPFGTEIYIEHFDNVFTCEDRGGAIRGRKLDVYMGDLDEAIKFGRKTLKIEVIKWGG